MSAAFSFRNQETPSSQYTSDCEPSIHSLNKLNTLS